MEETHTELGKSFEVGDSDVLLDELALAQGILSRTTARHGTIGHAKWWLRAARRAVLAQRTGELSHVSMPKNGKWPKLSGTFLRNHSCGSSFPTCSRPCATRPVATN